MHPVNPPYQRFAAASASKRVISVGVNVAFHRLTASGAEAQLLEKEELIRERESKGAGI